jgi:hypothetical protein
MPRRRILSMHVASLRKQITALLRQQLSLLWLCTIDVVVAERASVRPVRPHGMWENLAFAPQTCLLSAARPVASGLSMQT